MIQHNLSELGLSLLEVTYNNNFLELLISENITKDFWHKIEQKFVMYDQYIKILNTSRSDKGYTIKALYASSQSKLEEIYLKYSNILDHKELGQMLDMFYMHPYSQGSVMFWTKHGIRAFSYLEQLIKSVIKDNYHEISSANLLNKQLFEHSGHLQKFTHNILWLKDDTFILRPMACPQHILYFNLKPRSYKELPFRIYETNTCWRNEARGAVNGLLRARVFRQDDGHIFCTEEQVISEVQLFIKNLEFVYNQLGFIEYKFYLATRPEEYIGEIYEWDKAESLLKASIPGIQEAKSEGAFYGPKIEVHLKDAFDRWWQCGTIQLDMFLGSRLNVFYTDLEGNRKHPIILHRAIYGSFERMLGILLESTQGWLADPMIPYHVLLVCLDQGKAAKILQLSSNIRVLECHESLSAAINISYKYRIPRIWIAGTKEGVDEILVRYHDNTQSVKKITSAIDEVKFE